MNNFIAILNILVLTIFYADAQTVYIDIDSGKIVGVDDGKRTQGNYPNQQLYPNYGGQRGQVNYPNQRPVYPNNQQRQYPSQQYQNYRPGAQGGNQNAEWVCRNTVTGDMMIIANGGAGQGGQPQFPNSNVQNPYQDNPWLRPQIPGIAEPTWTQPTPNRISEAPPTTPTPAPQRTEPPQTAPPPSTSSKRPFPTLDDIDWTVFLDKTTAKPSTAGSLNAAIDGEGIIQPRIT